MAVKIAMMGEVLAKSWPEHTGTMIRIKIMKSEHLSNNSRIFTENYACGSTDLFLGIFLMFLHSG